MPLVDIHCHVLAGLDDGPGDWDEALAMCRIAWDDGTRAIAATAHLGEDWPAVNGQRIRAATAELAARLRAIEMPLTIYPSAEIMVRPDLDAAWQRGELFSVADRSAYLLIELPHGLYLDLRHTVSRLRACQVRPILAHPERQEELLYDPGVIEALIERGCLVQVNADSIAAPVRSRMAQTLKRWVQRGVVHLIGSDGHSPEHRAPLMAAAYDRIAAWAGNSTADRLCSLHGLAVLEGRELRPKNPEPARRKWFSFLRRRLRRA